MMDEFCMTTFYITVDKLETETKTRGKMHKKISEVFLSDVTNNVTSSYTKLKGIFSAVKN